MTQKEFTDRTNINPSPEDFDAITALYMANDMDKDEFCDAYLKIEKHPETATLVMEAGAELHSLTKEVNSLKRVMRETHDQMAIFIAEQAEVNSSASLRTKAIEMMGEAAYITWKIENNKNLWQLDLDLIKRIINQ